MRPFRDFAARGQSRGLRTKLLIAFLMLTVCLAPIQPAWTARLVLKDGRIIEGQTSPLSGMSNLLKAPPADGAPDIQPIRIVDDGLRRLFIPMRRIQEVLEGDSIVEERIHIDQPLIRGTRTVAGVGPIIDVRPWDEFGRRRFAMNTIGGRADVIQGITLITPRWTKVEALKDVRWDMRIATSSIPRDTLHTVLSKHIKQDNPDDRLKLVLLLLQAERYGEAEQELSEIIEDFPDLREQLEQPARTMIKQQGARQLLKEVLRLREAGRHQLAYASLDQFPTEGVSGEILQEVREHLAQYGDEQARYEAVLDRLEVLTEEIGDAGLKGRLDTATDEIAAELNINTLRRMVAFDQLQDDATLLAEEKLALAISGWLVGAANSTPNVAVALSLFDTRKLIRQYLNEPTKLKRDEIIGRIQSEEGGSPRYVAALVEHMRPPVPTDTNLELSPGFYQLQVAGLTPEPPVTYYVQLPPEYDPYRRYPAVVTLNGAGTTPVQQIDWWAGSPGDDGARNGHAARNGYIVISPAWAIAHQTKYGFSAREHAAVLNPLRDACRRFAIDTDRVFISGHSMGGNAAWDLALAHPDLWAGAIPIVAVSEKYCGRYWENGELVPMYVVSGELDGTKAIDNAQDLDRYMTRNFDVTVVEYLGRGHEHFFEEIIHLFDWMGRKRRNFFPREFECQTMRTWDNFFWWVELDQLPSRSVVEPHMWPPERNVRATATEASIRSSNGLYVKTGAGRVTLWLSPEIVEFDHRMRLQVNGTRLNTGDVRPSLTVLLEDVRRRGDRQHPFWAKVVMPSREIN